MEGKIAVVLMHGAGLGGFIWEEVVPRISRPTLMAEFPNRAKGDQANRGLALKDYTEAVAARVEGCDQGRVVLVAHSIAGCVALEVADRLGHRVAGILGIGAAIPRSGQSFISCLPIPQKLLMPLILRAFGTKPPRKAIEQGLCTDLSPEMCKRVLENFTPEAKGLYTDKVQYRALPSERWYVKLTADREFPSSVQEAMIANLEATRTIEVSSGHVPMMSRPEEVAAIVNDMADHCVRARSRDCA